MTHELRCWSEFFQATLDGQKSFEVRKQKDPPFAVGDYINLREYDPRLCQYTGRVSSFVITYLVEGPMTEAGLPDGTIVMSIERYYNED